MKLPNLTVPSLQAWLPFASVGAILAVGLATFSDSLTLLHLQLLMLAAVLLAALGLGLTVGLAAATCGFAVLLWRGMQTSPGLDLRTIIDAFLWFAVAKGLSANNRSILFVTWMDGIVPFAVEVVAADIEGGHLLGFKRSSQHLCALISATRQRLRQAFSNQASCVAGC